MLSKFLSAGFIFLSLPLAVASEGAVQLDPVKIEDSSEESTAFVNGESIETRQARDLEDTFRESPEVVVGGSSRVAQKVYVRGLEDTNLNVTVDGARQAGYLFHHQGRLNLDPELLKEVEVEAGTGDALSGPGALGGSIRFTTKDAEDLLVSGQTSGALVKSRYATNNEELGGALALFTKPSERWSALLYGNYAQSNNEKTGGDNVTIPYTSGRPRAWLGKVSVRPSVSQKLTIGYNFTSDNAARLVRSNLGYTPTQPVTDKVFETKNTTFNYKITPADSIVHAEIEAYRAENTLQHSSPTAQTTANFDSYGMSFKNKFRWTNLSLVAGADFNDDHALAKNASNSASENGEILGLFAQGNYKLSDRWGLGAGLRMDEYRLQTVDDSWLKQSHASPNATVRYRWSDDVSTSLGWAQSFKGPAPAEALLLANATSVAPTIDLKGIVAETTEVATHIKRGDDYVQVLLFQTKLHDPLEATVVNGVVQRVNGKETLEVEGYQAKYRHAENDWIGTLFFVHARTKYGANPLGYSGNFTRGVSLGDRVGLNLERKLPMKNLFLSWNSNLVLKLTDVPVNQKAQEGYDIHDFAVTWMADERLRAGVSVHNIFDRKYVAQGSVYANNARVENFLYEPGRDLRVSVSYIF